MLWNTYRYVKSKPWITFRTKSNSALERTFQIFSQQVPLSLLSAQDEERGCEVEPDSFQLQVKISQPTQEVHNVNQSSARDLMIRRTNTRLRERSMSYKTKLEDGEPLKPAEVSF